MCVCRLYIPQHPLPTSSCHHHAGNSKGFAFIKFSTRESAKDCMSRLGGQEIAGRQVKVGPVTDYKPNIPTWGMDAG
ncbi:hypothetical protein EON65_51980, partial [archaeon]